MQKSLIPPIYASDDTTLNWATVGLPYMLQAEEARGENDGSDAWAAQVDANTTRQLSFRLEPQSNFWIDGVTCHLYSVADSQGVKTLTAIDPKSTIATVMLRANDSRQNWQRSAMLWSNLAGTGSSMQWLGLPQVMYGGDTVTVTCENQSDTVDYAICLVLHGRRRRANVSGGGFSPLPDPKYLTALVEKQRREGTGMRIPLSDSNAENAQRVGVTRFVAPKTHTALTGTSSWTAMQHAQETIFQDAHYNTFVRFARQWVVNKNGVRVTRPLIFVRLTDDRFKNAWSNMPVPINAAFGSDGGHPYVMPVDWVWERQGTVHLDIYSALANSDHKVWLTFEGWWRKGEN